MAERRSRPDYSVSRGIFSSEDDASDEIGGGTVRGRRAADADVSLVTQVESETYKGPGFDGLES
tara:strand:- start:32014 stop:32205 length:192 start_codon:yes stop_codon:yes gene_type:complete